MEKESFPKSNIEKPEEPASMEEDWEKSQRKWREEIAKENAEIEAYPLPEVSGELSSVFIKYLDEKGVAGWATLKVTALREEAFELLKRLTSIYYGGDDRKKASTLFKIKKIVRLIEKINSSASGSEENEHFWNALGEQGIEFADHPSEDGQYRESWLVGVYPYAGKEGKKEMELTFERIERSQEAKQRETRKEELEGLQERILEAMAG